MLNIILNVEISMSKLL